MRQAMTIGAVARAAGATIETIRFYEKSGLLPPARRTAANYRTYNDADVKRVCFIRRARDLGFPLPAIRTLLALSDDPGRDCSAVDALVGQQLAEVERKLAALSRLRDELDDLRRRCGADRRIADCRILEALAP